MRDVCLVGALHRRELWGIWGGVVFPATVRSCVRVAATSETGEVVWRLRWTTGRGEVVTFGSYSRWDEAGSAADRLLGGLRNADQAPFLPEWSQPWAA